MNEGGMKKSRVKKRSIFLYFGYTVPISGVKKVFCGLKVISRLLVKRWKEHLHDNCQGHTLDLKW